VSHCQRLEAAATHSLEANATPKRNRNHDCKGAAHQVRRRMLQGRSLAVAAPMRITGACSSVLIP
jgi:hypothetical protein